MYYVCYLGLGRDIQKLGSDLAAIVQFSQDQD